MRLVKLSFDELTQENARLKAQVLTLEGQVATVTSHLDKLFKTPLTKVESSQARTSSNSSATPDNERIIVD